MTTPLLAPEFCQIAWVGKDIVAAEKFFIETMGIPRFLHLEGLAAKDTEGTYLGMPLVELRPTVHKLSTQHLLIPLSGPLLITNLDIDVLYHRNPGHGCASCHLSFAPLNRFPARDALDNCIASGMKAF